ncbi:hypothetical protein TcCL_ESM05038 [Trypanosoma cruzi]|nr:hypothetical protein TcCL_ESM05038 [Trypanosoma cruzi]
MSNTYMPSPFFPRSSTQPPTPSRYEGVDAPSSFIQVSDFVFSSCFVFFTLHSRHAQKHGVVRAYKCVYICDTIACALYKYVMPGVVSADLMRSDWAAQHVPPGSATNPSTASLPIFL